MTYDRILIRLFVKFERKMTTVKISPKYQVLIPKEIREKLKLEPGEELQIFQHGDWIELIPLKAIKN